MTLTQLAPPYPIFTDKSGAPLDNGYLYFGAANLNPETNPITVYYDRALTQPASQPLRTSNGYVMRNGSPAIIYANSQFSVTVRDKNRAMVIYSPVGYGIVPGTSASSTDQITYNQGSTGSVSRVLTARLQDYVSVKDFGVVGDGVTNDAATLSAITTFPAAFPPGTYKVDSDVKGLGKQFSGFGGVKFLGAGRVQTSTVLGIGALANGTGFDTATPTLTDKNVAIGTRAMFNSTTAYHCVAVGDEALYSQTTGSQNTAIGLNSQYYLTTGDGNTSVGVSSLRDNITGINNTAVGRSAGFSVLGNYNTLMGRNCAWQKTAGNDDVLVGANIMWNTSTGGLGLNTAVGHQAYYSATTPKSNVGIGWYAGFGVTTGQQQVLIGAETGFADAPTGQVAVGYQALKNGTGLYNVAMGSTALVSLTTGYSHTAVGYQAGFSSTTGYYNTYFGYRAGRATITSTGNTYIGADAGWRATGETNTVVGSNSFSASSTATASTIVGRMAGLVLASGNGNTFIGEQAGNLQTAGSNNILIGQSTNAPSATGSDQVVISTGKVGMWLGITGTPEGVITAAVGSIATRADGGASTTFYVKQSGSGNTGWVAK